MRGLHPATWVVLKLRCSTALCLLVLPAHEQQQRRIRNGQQQQQQHVHFPTAAATTTTTTTLGTSTNPTHPAWLAAATTTALREASRNDYEQQQQLGRLARLKEKALAVTKWGPFQVFLNGGKSIVGLFRVDQSKTEMEAATAFDRPPPRRLVTRKQAKKEKVEKEEAKSVSSSTTTSTTSTAASDSDEFVFPKGTRWAIAHPDTDLSGTWKPIITNEFRDEYDQYLANCGTTFVFRQLCLKFCSTTRETIDQVDQGRILHFHGKTPAGGWKRSLISSGADSSTINDDDWQVYHTEFLDPDKELVKVEAWWEDDGRVHRSVLRDKPRVCGGEFETARYLTKNEDNQVILVTESTFHPAKEHLRNPSSRFKQAFVRWKYLREDI